MSRLLSIFLVSSRVVVRLWLISYQLCVALRVKCEGPLGSKSEGNNQIDRGVGVRIVLS